MENRWLKVGFRQISGKWYLYLWGNFSYQSKYHYTYIQGDIDVFIGLKYVKQIKVSNVIPNIDNKNHELLATWQRVCIPEDNQEVMQGSLAWRGSAGRCTNPMPQYLKSKLSIWRVNSQEASFSWHTSHYYITQRADPRVHIVNRVIQTSKRF